MAAVICTHIVHQTRAWPGAPVDMGRSHVSVCVNPWTAKESENKFDV